MREKEELQEQKKKEMLKKQWIEKEKQKVREKEELKEAEKEKLQEEMPQEEVKDEMVENKATEDKEAAKDRMSVEERIRPLFENCTDSLDDVEVTGIKVRISSPHKSRMMLIQQQDLLDLMGEELMAFEASLANKVPAAEEHHCSARVVFEWAHAILQQMKELTERQRWAVAWVAHRYMRKMKVAQAEQRRLWSKRRGHHQEEVELNTPVSASAKDIWPPYFADDTSTAKKNKKQSISELQTHDRVCTAPFEWDETTQIKHTQICSLTPA